MHRGVTVLICFCCVHLSTVDGITCSVTLEDGLTRYSVPEFTATNCHYRWTNITNHVLANHEGKNDELVLMKTNRTLLTSVCSGHIFYMRDCISEGMPHEANCTINCSGNSWLKSGEGFYNSHWFAVVAAFAAVAAIALLLVVAFLKCRKQLDEQTVLGGFFTLQQRV